MQGEESRKVQEKEILHNISSMLSFALHKQMGYSSFQLDFLISSAPLSLAPAHLGSNACFIESLVCR